MREGGRPVPTRVDEVAWEEVLVVASCAVGGVSAAWRREWNVSNKSAPNFPNIRVRDEGERIGAGEECAKVRRSTVSNENLRGKAGIVLVSQLAIVS